MFKIEAPYPGLQTTTILPSPEWGDSIAGPGALQILRSMNGKVQTYKKNKQDRRRLRWSFRLTRNKVLELKAFLKVYHASVVRLTDSDGIIRLGYLQTNPFEYSDGVRAGGVPGNEMQRITLEFEEKV